MSQTVAVLDIGKSNVKLALFNHGRLLWEKSAANRILPGPPYPHEDVEGAWHFFVDALREVGREHKVDAIVPTAHGAAGALIGARDLAAPVMDYEFPDVEQIEPDYAKIRPPFSESLSPKVPAGLNLGRQLAYQKWRCPDLFATAKHFVAYPQYWAWRLTGVAASEVTSLGCHTDLWAPRRGDVSNLVRALGVGSLIPPLRRAFDRLGPIRAEIAAATSLAPETQVFCGIHDSNASLLPYLVSRDVPFTVLSTGTWVILMCVGLSVDRLDPRDDTLANVDALGRPIACGRFMGGREYAVIAGGSGSPDFEAIERIITSGALPLPCFSGQGGPYATTKGAVRGEVAQRDRTALATLYCALVSDLMLTRMGATSGDLVVEGTFAGNLAYCQTLGALRLKQRVFAAADAAGTARGAAMVAHWPPSYPIEAPLLVPTVSIAGLDAYRDAWVASIRDRRHSP
jgi:sugar (pentulose or hexulose) kinase